VSRRRRLHRRQVGRVVQYNHTTMVFSSANVSIVIVVVATVLFSSIPKSDGVFHSKHTSFFRKFGFKRQNSKDTMGLK
jgi:hypothetical protein